MITRTEHPLRHAIVIGMSSCQPLLTTDVTLEELGLQDGQRVTHEQMIEVISANTAAIEAGSRLRSIVKEHGK